MRKSGILLLFFLSGLCGLVYEVAWTRLMSLIFGATVFAVSTVIASFMAGLALGSFYFGRLAVKHKNPLRLYAFLEAATGLAALVLPCVLDLLKPVYILIHNAVGFNFYVLSLLRFILIFILLLVPTTLMGGTLPVLAKFLVRKAEYIARDAGMLYAANTFGAVTGCLLAGFFLIENAGVKGSVGIAAFVNLLIASSAFIMGRGEVFQEGQGTAACPRKYTAGSSALPLAVFAASGFCALAYEVLWARVLVYFLTSNTYSFSMMLATFLFFLSVGSFVFARLTDRLRNPVSLFAAVETLAGISAILSMALLPVADSLLGVPSRWFNWVLTKSLLCASVMMLPAFFMGGAFPLVSRIYSASSGGTSVSIGNIYCANTAFGVAGSVIAGFVLIPVLGIERSILLVGFVNMALGALLVLADTVQNRVFKSVTVASLLALMLFFALSIPVSKPLILKSKLLHASPSPARLMFYKEDITATVSVLDLAGDRKLNIDGFNAAGTKKYEYMKMLAHLPLLLAGDYGDVLVLCFGTGTTCGAALRHDVAGVDCVEISAAVMEAAPHYASYNNNVLSDARLRVILEDGRNYLLYGDKKYDVITAEPMHPYLSHAVDFYSKDFYEVCRSRLKEGGVMCQWAPMHVLSGEDYRMMLSTFREVFPHATMWFVGTEGILIGTLERLNIDFALLEKRLAAENVRESLSAIAYDDIFAVLDSHVMDEEALGEYVKGSRIISDNFPYLEFTAPRSLVMTASETWVANMEEISRRKTEISSLVNAGRDKRDTLRNYYAASRHVMKGIMLSAEQRFREEASEYAMALLINPGDRRITRHIGDAKEKLKYVYFNEGKNHASSSDYEKAVSSFERVLEIDPAFAAAHNELALAYNDMGMFEKSIEECKKAISLSPSVAAAHTNLGIVYMNINRYEAAAEEFVKAIDIDPDSATAHYYLGLAYGRTGRQEEGEGELKKAARLKVRPKRRAKKE